MPLGWLRNILANALADLMRQYHQAESRKLAWEHSLERLLETSPGGLNLLARPGHSASESAQRRELGVLLADAMAELSDDYREVLVLRSLEERDWDEVARRMGRTPGAVRMLWTRALREVLSIVVDADFIRRRPLA